jgi:predicted N-acyltransferase
MPKITYQVYQSIDQIGKTNWDAVFGNIPESYVFYKVLAASGLDDFTFLYLVIYGDNELISIAPLFTADFNLDIAVEGWLSGLIKCVRRIFPRLLIFKTLFCGSPFSEYGVLGVRQSFADSSKIIPAVHAGLKELAAKTDARLIIFKDFLESSQPFLDPLRREGFARMESFPNVAVEVNYKSFPEYLETLGRSTRKNLKRKLKETGAGGHVRVETVRDITPYIDQVVKLYENAYHGGSTKFERLTKEFFLSASRDLAPHTLFFLYYVDNRLGAFNLCFVYDNLFIDKFIGFDYDVSNRYHLYFVSWANNIQWCIDNSLCYYHPGQTDYEPKIRLGGKLVPLFVYVKHCNAVLNFILKPLTLILKPDNFDPDLK